MERFITVRDTRRNPCSVVKHRVPPDPGDMNHSGIHGPLFFYRYKVMFVEPLFVSLIIPSSLLYAPPPPIIRLRRSVPPVFCKLLFNIGGKGRRDAIAARFRVPRAKYKTARQVGDRAEKGKGLRSRQRRPPASMDCRFPSNSPQR